VIEFGRNKLMASAAVALMVAGGAVAYSSARAAGPVDIPSAGPVGAPQSFADIFQKVSPAVVSIDITGRASPSEVAMMGGQDQDGQDQDGQNQGGQNQGGQNKDGQGLPFPFPLPPGFDGGQGQHFQFKRFGQGQQQPDGRDLPKIQASGSGFFVSPDGYIVTNNHVVEHADTITVHTADKRTLKAHLIGTDPSTDLAVIKVDGGAYPYVSFEEQAKPRVGDWVVAVGNPFGLGGTATAGIVSALGRENVDDTRLVDYMQIDAPINRGNSGGPTFDVYGRVVGVNTAIFSPSGGSVGIGFDIPADVASSITRQIIAGGKVAHGYIGATIQGISPDMSASLGLKSTDGAIVAALTDGGPAEKSGVRIGDVVLAVNGKTVTSANDLTRQVAFSHPGDVLRLTVLRDGRRTDVDLHAGLRPSEAKLARMLNGGAGGDEDGGEEGGSARPGGPHVLGMGLAQLDRAERERFNLTPGAHGVVVESVGENSDAADKGLKPGDVIMKAGAHAATQPSDIAAAVADARRDGRTSVLLLVSRDGQTVFVPVDLDKMG
jgi:serine protease Do